MTEPAGASEATSALLVHRRMCHDALVPAPPEQVLTGVSHWCPQGSPPDHMQAIASCCALLRVRCALQWASSSTSTTLLTISLAISGSIEKSKRRACLRSHTRAPESSCTMRTRCALPRDSTSRHVSLPLPPSSSAVTATAQASVLLASDVNAGSLPAVSRWLRAAKAAEQAAPLGSA